MPSRAKIRVLLIDDDPLYGNVLRRKAESLGVSLDHHESLVAALYDRYLIEYDVAIIDCVMPGLDGFEVSSYLSRFFGGGVPVLLVSQTDDSRSRFLADRTGARAFLSKDRGPMAILDAARRLARGDAHAF